MYKESPRERERERNGPDRKRRTEIQIPSTEIQIPSTEIQIPSTKSRDVYWKLGCSIVDTHTHTHTHPCWSCWLALQCSHGCLAPAKSLANSLFANAYTHTYMRACTHTHIHTRTHARAHGACADVLAQDCDPSLLRFVDEEGRSCLWLAVSMGRDEVAKVYGV